jgi:hypothetical protein
MVSFKANPQGIREFSAHIGRLGSDAESAAFYSRSWLSYWGSEGLLFDSVADAAKRVSDVLIPNYFRLQEVVEASAAELALAAHFYETTDQAAAELLDKTY